MNALEIHLDREQFLRALQALLDLGLLSPVETHEGEQRFIVHRWTAQAITKLSTEDVRRGAHRRAARYRRYRVDQLAEESPPDLLQDSLEQFLEARFHHHRAGDLDGEIAALADGCGILTRWGDYGRLKQLYRETLERVPTGSQEHIGMQQELGNVAFSQGSFDEALDGYRKALRGAQERGDRPALADARHQIGMVHQSRGFYDEAVTWYKQALEIYKGLEDWSSVGGSYHQLGNVAYLRQQLEDALSWYEQALAIFERLEQEDRISDTYHQLGMVAYDRGNHDEAETWFRRSVEIDEDMEEQVGRAASYHHLGLLAEERDSYTEALRFYRASLEIDEEAGNAIGIAASYHQLANLAQRRGDYSKALEWHERSLELSRQAGHRSGMADSYSQLGCLATEQGAPEEGVPLNLKGLLLRLEMGAPAIFDLHWLGRQRELLGRERFHAVLVEELDEPDRRAVKELLDVHGSTDRPSRSNRTAEP